MEIHLQKPTDAARLAPEIWPVYETVFGDFDSYEIWRTDLFDRHAARDGYRLVTAVDGPTPAGFAWGYIGGRGQYWSDLVCDSLPTAITDDLTDPAVRLYLSSGWHKLGVLRPGIQVMGRP